ncbi:MAG: gephyrin-like molybdotransferase Glp [Gemmataceae bacterium]
MLEVSQAQAIILQHANPLPPVRVRLTSAARGLVLAEAVRSDIDSPPYDKAMMDGYAVRTADLTSGAAVLDVIEEVTAGRTPTRTVAAGQATRIMTGAPLPAGADAVVMIERTQPLDGQRVHIEGGPIQPGLNILPRGREMRAGEAVLHPGAELRPQEFGLLAAVGCDEVAVFPRPKVAILPTGDELVEAAVKPGPGQIRNSNGPMLAAQVERAGGVAVPLDIARDKVEHLKRFIVQGLEQDVLLLSGGVSAGQLDLVPEVLTQLGVTSHFHKVAMKPGKPILFGTRGTTLVFGLPGNPVSSLACFELFVRPALRRLGGRNEPGPRWWSLPLAMDFAYRTDRPTYYPVRLEVSEDGGLRFRPLPWFGSADLRALTQANALALFPAGDTRHGAGQHFPVLPMDLEGW